MKGEDWLRKEWDTQGTEGEWFKEYAVWQEVHPEIEICDLHWDLMTFSSKDMCLVQMQLLVGVSEHANRKTLKCC